jgi:hypothetical protein
VSDIDTAAADSLKALDPKRPIREADIEMRWSPEGSVANDPNATLAVRCDNGFDVVFSPYQTTRLSR